MEVSFYVKEIFKPYSKEIKRRTPGNLESVSSILKKVKCTASGVSGMNIAVVVGDGSAEKTKK